MDRLSKTFRPSALMRKLHPIPLTALGLLVAGPCFGESLNPPISLTHHWVGFGALAIFFLAYVLAMLEESTELRKSKPMVLAASIIWVLIAAIYVRDGQSALSSAAFRSSLEGYAELFLFILVSMTYLNAMEQRGVFTTLRAWLLSRNFGYKTLFWVTGLLSFFMSSILNNLTTALLMGAVLLALGKNNRKFIGPSCVNVVVATNAGGSFSPFGDITTLLVWQEGVIPFIDFFSLFLPAVVNFILPACIMHFWIPKGQPEASGEKPFLRRGAMGIIVLFLLTVLTAVAFQNYLDLPPAAGMLAGLSYLSFYFFYLYNSRHKDLQASDDDVATLLAEKAGEDAEDPHKLFDVFRNISKLEWDTLLYFYGVMVSVAGLSFMGYLHLASEALYHHLDPTVANILVGIVSAFIDNGTIMYAVLSMAPDISQGQWLLITLTAGVGGSLLAIGSAAGVGLLGQMRGRYTFVSHLAWTPVIALGYAGSIVCHFLLNSRYF